MFIVFFGVVFGLLATVAEPALVVLARPTHMIMDIVNETAFIWVMGAGIGVIFAVVLFVPEQFVALAFDGSGASHAGNGVPF